MLSDRLTEKAGLLDMIQSLKIENIALIESLQVDFHPGLQVLSGETGAGKSIVVDAVNLILGGRADRELIRSGCGKATVEAEFETPENAGILAWMNREEIDYDGKTVSVYRELSSNGRNLCRVNGVPVSLGSLKELACFLMDLHGQSEHQMLADPLTHIGYLDSLGDESHQALLRSVKEKCESFLTNHRAYAKLVRQNDQKAARMSVIEKALEEMNRLKLRKGEGDRLLQELKRLSESEKITAALRQVYDLLATGETEPSALEKIKQASYLMKGLSGISEELDARCESAYYELEEIAYELSSAIDRNESDPERLEQVEARLSQLHRLESKLGLEGDQLIEEKSRLEEEYKTLAGLDDAVEEMSREHKRLLSLYRMEAQRLSESRKQLAGAFEQHMTRELSELGMGNTIFQVCFADKQEGKPRMPTETGDDQLEFMMSPNPGEPLKPMAKIASGGELSRLMLAMKTIEAGRTGVDAMVFDEIDTGISGRMAQVVAEKMIRISRARQVICVSHLPQLASAADWQYLVSKAQVGDRTVTSVRELNQEGRIAEISRMISGAEGITKDAAAYAEKMLQAAEKSKVTLSFIDDSGIL